MPSPSRHIGCILCALFAATPPPIVMVIAKWSKGHFKGRPGWTKQPTGPTTPFLHFASKWRNHNQAKSAERPLPRRGGGEQVHGSGSGQRDEEEGGVRDHLEGGLRLVWLPIACSGDPPSGGQRRTPFHHTGASAQTIPLSESGKNPHFEPVVLPVSGSGK